MVRFARQQSAMQWFLAHILLGTLIDGLHLHHCFSIITSLKVHRVLG